MRKESFKGLEEEQVSKLSMEDFMKLTTSRLRRTLKRLNQNPRLKSFIKKVRETKAKNPKKMIKTQLRDAVILPEWLGMKFAVHNGKEYKQFQISLQMLGHRLGDFSHTTGRVLHSGPGVGATRGSKFVPLK
ncbi:ribosomal protein S19 family protein [Candidatus Micrarchaeota archaeon]|nr:ribosomal protein S19 family protein [Candidatus Micrarchaeota archaeon]